MINIHEKLMQKAVKNELAHFYIVETLAPEEEAFNQLTQFTYDFIQDYYHKIEKQKLTLAQLKAHPDLFILGQLPDSEEEESTFFSVEESQSFSRFFDFNPIQGKRKFAIITQGHRINTIIANKWLKLFEEPHGQVSIFLLNPRSQKLLDTIHSRAQHLRLRGQVTPVGQEELKEFLVRSSTQSLSLFLEQNTKELKDVTYWTREIIHWEAEQLENAQCKMNLIKWLKDLQQMETFHQPSATKWALFYSFLQQNVFERLGR